MKNDIWHATKVGTKENGTTLIFINKNGRVFRQWGNGYWFVPRRGYPYGGTKKECLAMARGEK